MKNEKAQKLYAGIIADLENGAVDVEKITKAIDQLREIAREIEDPLVLKTLRFIKEKLANDPSFDIEIEVDEEEEEEEEAPENHLLYLFQLLTESDNKYNREEIKQYRAALQLDLY